MATIRIDIELDEEVADDSDSTGLTNEAFERLMDIVNEFGTIADGPRKVG